MTGRCDMRRLFLDDDPLRCKRFRSLHPDATIVSTAEACIAALDNDGPWDEVYLDHDLLGPLTTCWSDNPLSGMEVVRHIERRCMGRSPSPLVVRRFIIHTANSCARMEMAHRLANWHYTAELCPAHTFLGPSVPFTE